MTLNAGKSNKPAHLDQFAFELLDKSVEERVFDIRKPKWINYSRANEALNVLRDLMSYPRSHRMDNLLIYGNTNNGKTMILNRFMREFPNDDNLDGNARVLPVLYILMPPVPSVRDFYGDILMQLNAVYRLTAGPGELQAQVIEILRECNTKMLIIDELNNILDCRPMVRKQFLNIIRHLGNSLKIPIVAAGIDKVLTAFQSDDQLANRFIPFHLPLWQDSEEYREMLIRLEYTLPLPEPSFLYSDLMTAHIRAKAKNRIGGSFNIVRDAAVYAVRNSKSKIDLDCLENCGFFAIDDDGRRIQRKKLK